MILLLSNKSLAIISAGVFIIFLSVFVYSCSDPASGTNGTLPTIDPEILVTDETGFIRGGDYTDWCLNEGTGQHGFGPAYPNPTNGSVSVKFNLAVSDTLSLYFYNGGDTTYLFKNTPFAVGSYSMNIDGTSLNFSNSYRRLFIANKRGLMPASTGCNNFGDIHFR